jgi:hypothetical protein
MTDLHGVHALNEVNGRAREIFDLSCSYTPDEVNKQLDYHRCGCPVGKIGS